jgi:hypothetical protein
MKILKKLFQSTAISKSSAVVEQDRNGLIYYVKNHKCGEITRIRIDKNNELSRNEEREGFFIRKVIVDSKCFGKSEIEINFDEGYREVSKSIIGGEFVDRDAWETQKTQK